VTAGIAYLLRVQKQNAALRIFQKCFYSLCHVWRINLKQTKVAWLAFAECHGDESGNMAKTLDDSFFQDGSRE
jgi:hypothetical protein